MNILFLLFALFLIAHGLMHVYYMTPAPPPGPVQWPFQLNHSWLLMPLRLDNIARPLGILLCLVTIMGFALTGLGMLGIPILNEWWRTLALVSASASLVLLVVFWNWMLVLGIVINGAIIAALLWNESPLRELAASLKG